MKVITEMSETHQKIGLETVMTQSLGLPLLIMMVITERSETQTNQA